MSPTSAAAGPRSTACATHRAPSRAQAGLEAAELDAKLAAERVDLPCRRRPSAGPGAPTMQVLDEMIAVFAEMGFGWPKAGHRGRLQLHGAELPAQAPGAGDARHLLAARGRTRRAAAAHPHQPRAGPHQQGQNKTLPGWIAQGQAPPIRVIVPGRTYRSDSDATHTPMFHQLEGLVIDRNIHMGHLKWTVDQFISRYFETPVVETRFRPHHFPFTEPSAEMDVKCDRSGKDVKIGQGQDWMEIVGCGMVHPGAAQLRPRS
jgi:phenylalanyl-tRNA synthetase alpha chain